MPKQANIVTNRLILRIVWIKQLINHYKTQEAPEEIAATINCLQIQLRFHDLVVI